LTHNRVTPEAYVAPEAVRRLEAVSAPGNMSALHHADRRRWCGFLIQTHVERADFDPLLLAAILSLPAVRSYSSRDKITGGRALFKMGG
jgi:hypothetical protein